MHTATPYVFITVIVFVSALEKDGGGALSADEEEQYWLAKSKMLGNIKFIGELGKLDMLHEGILHQCIKQLLGTSVRQCSKQLLGTSVSALSSSSMRQSVASWCITASISVNDFDFFMLSRLG